MEKGKSRWEWQSHWLWGQMGLIILLGLLTIYNSAREDMVRCLPFRLPLLGIFFLLLPPLFGLFYDWKKSRQGEEGGAHILKGVVYYYIVAWIALVVLSGICDSIASPY